MSDNNIDKYSPPSDVLVITDRNMSHVLGDLNCNIDFFREKRVLSVGEGLSGFANGLAENGINVTAVDPIYAAGDRLLNSNAPPDDEVSGKHTIFRSYRASNEEYNPPQKEKVKIVAADSNALPFRDGEFDLVVANKLYEHVDMSQVLPEMIRVLKGTNGELRFGGLTLHCVPQEGKLISGMYDKGNVGYFLHKHPGFAKSLERLGAEHPEVSVYVVVGNPSRYSFIYDNFRAHMVKNLIFVRGNQIPFINNTQGNTEYDGKLYKVNPSTLDMTIVAR